ncbi:hypothetical protein PPL_11393 [Heterostelium album PN500]|uniref:Lysosomal dipeptide transporter MFSD1 n=1 Tax=Heterostelium pallidum (strain ATCC 26659 / Pp 5 / PN500) TaxID=670386 RepID=D3BTA0_HETP5|nr:hypothetical protein PPL_11393 [Heterostelium album PN500]EFA75317.1 hypothetical protein PPL_11393 [Heterostelium album PN500]|eukprot:XP_020427451.1 hypothetical protein PPL_11393 [Heterostelium album PN500]
MGALPNQNKSTTFLGISKNTIKKCVVMFLIANLGYGLQLSYSTPVALSQTYFKELKISEEQYGLLFSVYSLPNLIMIIVGGILIDILGTDIISIIFCGIAAFSSIFTVLSMPHFNLMMVGRFLLGMGGETLLACATTMIPLFYSPREVPICMGFLACWFYWGNLTAMLALPTINSIWGFRPALWLVAAVFILEFILNLVLCKFRERLKWSDQIDRSASAVSLKHINSEVSMMSEDRDLQDPDNESPTISLNGEQHVQGAIQSKWEIFVYKLSEVKDMSKRLSKRFWLLALICFISFYTMFGLAIIGTDVLEHKFGYDESKAALIMASEAMVNGILPMFTGMFIQRVRGRKIQLMILACILLGLGTFFLNVTEYLDMKAPLNESLDSPYSTAGMDNPPEQIVEKEENLGTIQDEEVADQHQPNINNIGDEEYEPINSVIIS